MLKNLELKDRMAATRTARSWHAQRPFLWRRLASIRVWTTASAVEKVAFAFDDGSRERYGPISAECVASCRPFELLRDEVLVAVCAAVKPGARAVDLCALGDGGVDEAMGKIYNQKN